jgi:hypothetical protein
VLTRKKALQREVIVLNYSHQENIYQLWRSLRFGDNLQQSRFAGTIGPHQTGGKTLKNNESGPLLARRAEHHDAERLRATHRTRHA